jgi:tRNA A37 methylthiotransferase MiaB
MRIKFVVLTGEAVPISEKEKSIDETFDGNMKEIHLSNLTSKSELADLCQTPGANFITLMPVYYFLKSFYKKVGKHFDKYTWFPPEYGYNSIEYVTSIVDSIITDKIELVCFSVYLWNNDVSHKIAKILKELNPDIKIVVGGPHVDYINVDFEKHWYVDYFVYGDGEETFQILLDSFYEPIDEKTIPNLITKEFKTQHKIFKFKEFPPYNQILDVKEDFELDYNSIMTRVLENNVDSWTKIALGYERVRGCPYACSFCDWSAGLHKKVNVRLTNWKEEFEYISNFNIILRLIDANFGIHREDKDLYNFVLPFVKKNPNFSFNISNVNKLHKEKVFDMFEQQYDHGRRSFKLSLQNIDEDILKNIDRPEIPWETHRKLMIDFKKTCPGSLFQVEIIEGLPGSTIDLQKKQLLEFAKVPINHVLNFKWHLLPNSPAYTEAYQKKYNLIKRDVVMFEGNTIFVDSNIEDLYNSVENSTHNISDIYRADILYDNEEGLESYITQLYMSTLYNKIAFIDNDHENNVIKFNKLLDLTLLHIKRFAKQHAIEFEKRTDRYGFFIFGLPYGNDKVVRIDSLANIMLERLFYKEIDNLGRKSSEDWVY